jgi:hypothetical protein
MRRALWLVAALTAVFLLVWRWPFHNPFAGAASYLPLHMVFETVAIVIFRQICSQGSWSRIGADSAHRRGAAWAWPSHSARGGAG